MLQWFAQDDMEGLQAFATRVLPHVMNFDYQNG